MDAAQLLPGEEKVTTKSFPVRKTVLIGILMSVLAAIVVMLTIRHSSGNDNELFTSVHVATLPPGVSICQNADRIVHVRRYCQQHRRLHQDVDTVPVRRLRHVIVDDKHKILYCAVPGTGYSSIVRLLAHHRAGVPPGGDTKLMERSGLRYLSSYDPNEIQHMLEHFYKFVLVRHPLVRLKSAFVHMFLQDSVGIEKYGPAIERMYGTSRLSTSSGRFQITFYQFLQMITRSKSFRDEQWLTYTTMCLPCAIHYDTILKLETVQNDIQAIMDRLNADRNATYPGYEVFWNMKNLGEYNITTQVFRTVPARLLGQLLKHYQNDLEMFGYAWKTDAGVECSIQTGNNTTCC